MAKRRIASAAEPKIGSVDTGEKILSAGVDVDSLWSVQWTGTDWLVNHTRNDALTFRVSDELDIPTVIAALEQ